MPPKVVPETRFSGERGRPRKACDEACAWRIASHTFRPPPSPPSPPPFPADALYAILEAAVSAPPGAPTLGTAEAAPSPPTLARLLATLHVLKAGWGAAALRFAVACAQAQEGEPLCTADGGDGGVGEAALWTAVTWAALPPSSAGGGPWGESWGSGGALPIPPALRAHLRVAWRSCELLPPPPPDDGGLGADGAGGEQAQGDAEEGDASGAAEEEEEGGGRATGGGAGEALGAAGVESQQQQQRQQGGAAAGAAPPPAAARVSVDDFVARVAGDAVLAWVWARDAAVPEARAAATA